MSKLRAMAEMLRSDNENERSIAATMIERQTGTTMADIVKRGSTRTMSGEPQGWVLDHIETKKGDEMIVAVTREIRASTTTWAEVVESGIEAVMQAKHSQQTRRSATADAFEGIFGTQRPESHRNMEGAFNATFSEATDELFAELLRTYKQDPSGYAANASGVVKEHMRSKNRTPKRVSRDELPIYATGLPKVVRKGAAKNGNPYIVVKFARMTATNGDVIMPMGEFIAFGNFATRVGEIANDGDTVSVTFKDGGDRSKMVEIKDAL